jgi:hypothetical protein
MSVEVNITEERVDKKSNRIESFYVWIKNLRHWKTGRAYRDLTRAMHDDPDYAHTWQCNIACPLMDSGMSYEDANKAADRLMSHLFGIKLGKSNDTQRIHDK